MTKGRNLKFSLVYGESGFSTVAFNTESHDGGCLLIGFGEQQNKLWVLLLGFLWVLLLGFGKRKDGKYAS
jgi:hypothetical protein